MMLTGQNDDPKTAIDFLCNYFNENRVKSAISKFPDERNR